MSRCDTARLITSAEDPTQSTQFSIVSNGCTAGVAGGAECTINVRFSPTTLGAKAAQLEVVVGAATLRTDIVGVGITPAALSLSTTTANFGNVAETDSANLTITVSNAGAETVTSLSSALSGAQAAQFSILPSSTCGATLAGMSSCTIDLRFTPAGQGLRGATLTVTGTPGGVLTAALSGTGIPDLLLEPNVLGETFDYGDVIVGNTSARVFTVTNQTIRSLSAVTIVSPTTSGTAQFQRTATTCGATLASGASCTVTVTFAPTGAAGARTTPFTVTGSGGATETQDLDGNAVGALRFTNWNTGGAPSSTFPAAFGSVPVGNVRNATLTVQNTGTINSGVIATQGTFTGDLNLVADTCSGANLAGGATCTITVRFYPQSVGDVTGTVTLNYGSNSTNAGITGRGVVGAGINAPASAP